MRKTFLTPGQEQEITPLLDKLFTLPIGKALVYKCEPSRADYLSRMIVGLRYHSAIESLYMYSPGDPTYGKGLYSCVHAEVHEHGLVLALLEEPERTLTWRFIECLATGNSIELDNPTATARSRFCRLRQKYPIFKNIWIDEGPPLMVRYAKDQPEKTFVVDIDIDPTSDNVPSPSARKNKPNGNM
jgi:hypothetical protein